MRHEMRAAWLAQGAVYGAATLRPEDVVRQVFDGVEAGQVEVLADARTRRIKNLLPEDHEKIYPAVQERWDAAHPGPAGPAT